MEISNKELLKEIIQTVRARKANIKNYKALCEVSDIVANWNLNQIDWDHSYIGWYKGKIAWAYIFSTNHTMPEKIHEGIKSYMPVEFIDIYCNESIYHALGSLQYHFWRYCGKFGKDIIYWKDCIELEDYKLILLNKLRCFRDDENDNMEQDIWDGIHDWGWGTIWESFGPESGRSQKLDNAYKSGKYNPKSR